MKASQILTLLLRQFPLQDSSLSQTDNSSSSESTPLQHHQLQPFLVFLATVVQGQSQPKRDVGVQCLESLLARPESRKEVWAIPGITAGSVQFRIPLVIEILTQPVALWILWSITLVHKWAIKLLSACGYYLSKRRLHHKLISSFISILSESWALRGKQEIWYHTTIDQGRTDERERKGHTRCSCHLQGKPQTSCNLWLSN